MGWINDLQGKTIGLDTAPLIYFIEENPVYIYDNFTEAAAFVLIALAASAFIRQVMMRC